MIKQVVKIFFCLVVAFILIKITFINVLIPNIIVSLIGAYVLYNVLNVKPNKEDSKNFN
jgi:hypothetical protein